MNRPKETIVDETGAVLFGPEDYPFSRLNSPGSFFVRGGISYTVISSVLDTEKNAIITAVKAQPPVWLGYHRIN